MQPFLLSVIKKGDNRVINFANNSNQFIEVVFVVDGKDIKEGKIQNEKTRGYAFPPKLDKPVTKMKNGQPIKLSGTGLVRACIFAGDGAYKDEDINKPAFLRHKLVDKISFRRLSDNPMCILETKY